MAATDTNELCKLLQHTIKTWREARLAEDSDADIWQAPYEAARRLMIAEMLQTYYSDRNDPRRNINYHLDQLRDECRRYSARQTYRNQLENTRDTLDPYSPEAMEIDEILISMETEDEDTGFAGPPPTIPT